MNPNLLNLLHFLVILFSKFCELKCHGMLLEPVSRSSRWHFNSSAPINYDDNGLNCGGYSVSAWVAVGWTDDWFAFAFQTQWNQNKGRCGLCGDNFQMRRPRPNENGGKYGNGVIVASYEGGMEIPVTVRLTANHKGYFLFDLCDLDEYSAESEDCFANFRLNLSDGNDRYIVPIFRPADFDMLVRLPEQVGCNHCVFRWTYVAGKLRAVVWSLSLDLWFVSGNNWGICPNGRGATGCGPQETFRGCSDIRILHRKTIESEVEIIF